jgi:hypothetical protein
MTGVKKMLTVKEAISLELEKLINQAKISLNEIKVVALAQAWKILQLAVASIIQTIENTSSDLAGKDKKAIAMELLNKFYDSVFIVVDIPFVPNLVEPIIHKYVKAFLMILVSSTIDAMVTTFRNTGVFVDPAIKANAFVNVKPRISEK